MRLRKKPKWSSELDDQSVSITPPPLAKKVGLSGRLLQRWDILLDWLSTPWGQIILATVALTAAWLLLKA